MRLRLLMEPRHGGGDQILALATAAAGFVAFFRSDHLPGVDPRRGGARALRGVPPRVRGGRP